ncbi:MAG: nucleotidyltransferase family protein [Planctomycetes bacterium]|nr:nucleotidyltransferase family protein [Planctomycetota bacterium]
MEPFEVTTRRGGAAAIREASRFFMQVDAVYKTLRRLARRFEEQDIPYAVVDGLALVAHGYRRTTEDVDVLVTAEGLQAAHATLVGLGYRSAFEASRSLRDTQTGVRVEFVVTGEFPGDGKPKPVAFPDPSAAFVDVEGIRYVSLPRLVELKLASGITNAGRLRDLADVQELIRVLRPPADFAQALDPYVRAKYRELEAATREDGGA